MRRRKNQEQAAALGPFPAPWKRRGACVVDAQGRVVMRMSDPDGAGAGVLRRILNLHDAYRCLAALARTCAGSHEPGSVEAVEAVREAERVLAAAK